jgi:hypothetical protein
MRLSPSGVVSSKYIRPVWSVVSGGSARHRSGSITVLEDGTSSPTLHLVSTTSMLGSSIPYRSAGFQFPQDLQI